jgi:hypothetical protein
MKRKLAIAIIGIVFVGVFVFAPIVPFHHQLDCHSQFCFTMCNPIVHETPIFYLTGIGVRVNHACDGFNYVLG